MLWSLFSKVLMKALPKYAPYIIFGIENRDALDQLWEGAKAIVRKFRKQYPDVPEDQVPDEKDVTEAVAASSAGKTGPLGFKKVRDWTPQEWKIFWDQGTRGGG